MTAVQLCSWLATRVSAMTGVAADAIDLDREVASYGLDSMAGVELIAELEAALGRQLDPALFWDFPTIRALAAQVAATIERSTT